MSTRQNISSGGAWEDRVGYSRAVRVGNIVEVAGTTAATEAGVEFPDDPYKQTHLVLQRIASVLEQAGSSMDQVVRTRMYVTNIAQWEAIGNAHRDFFSEVRPAATMVEVNRLIHRDMLVEIEVTAIIPDSE